MNPPCAQLLPPEIPYNQLSVILPTIGKVRWDLVTGEIYQMFPICHQVAYFVKMTSYIMSQNIYHYIFPELVVIDVTINIQKQHEELVRFR